jgi:uncharacterized protein YgbK (DUF1537 family)
MRIGPQIAAGVPGASPNAVTSRGVHVALKSGNFGDPDFFSRAFDLVKRGYET